MYTGSLNTILCRAMIRVKSHERDDFGMPCNIDHSLEDVKTKLQTQEEFLPKKLFSELKIFLINSLSQETLNEVFHLLKKYDLSEADEQLRRNKALEKIIKE